MTDAESPPSKTGKDSLAKLTEKRLADAVPFEAKRDSMIFKVFPGFVALFLAVAVIWFLVRGHYSFGQFLYTLCWSYAIGFMFLGAPCAYCTRANVIRGRFVLLGMILVSTAIGVAVWMIFGEGRLGISEFITGFWDVITDAFDGINYWTVQVSVYLVAGMVTLSTYGVVSVVVAYFRRHYHRILLSMEKKGGSCLKYSAISMFRVPGIIDVTEVVIELDTDSRRFDFEMFESITLYLILAGLIIASYLFLNPVFLESIQFEEMMAIVILLSLFVVVLVLPCSIVKRLNAKALSAAPRPYVLWEGMRSRMFQTYLILVVLTTLLWISAFTGMDFLRIVSQYVGYIIVMMLMSVLVAFVYTNSFYIVFRNGIVENFERAKADAEGAGHERSRPRCHRQGQAPGRERQPGGRDPHSRGVPRDRPAQRPPPHRARPRLCVFPEGPRRRQLPDRHRPRSGAGQPRRPEGVHDRQVPRKEVQRGDGPRVRASARSRVGEEGSRRVRGRLRGVRDVPAQADGGLPEGRGVLPQGHRGPPAALRIPSGPGRPSPQRHSRLRRRQGGAGGGHEVASGRCRCREGVRETSPREVR